MKKKWHPVLFILFLASCKDSPAQQSLTVSYSYSEKSKDSHSMTENFSLAGTTLTYAVQYTGRRGPSQKDESKTCTLNEEQAGSIRKAIVDKHLDVTDSLIDNSLQAGSYQATTTISISWTDGNKTSKIKIKGDPAAFGSKTLYKNSLSLLNSMRKVVKDCVQ